MGDRKKSSIIYDNSENNDLHREIFRVGRVGGRVTGQKRSQQYFITATELDGGPQERAEGGIGKGENGY